MESGWNIDLGSNYSESDEGSNSEVRNDLVDDVGKNIPVQNSNQLQVARLSNLMIPHDS